MIGRASGTGFLRGRRLTVTAMRSRTWTRRLSWGIPKFGVTLKDT